MPLELKSPIIQSTENVQKTPVAVELPEEIGRASCRERV